MEYVSAGESVDGCIFCNHLAEDDDSEARILYRGEATFVILNAFPYNTGHAMIAPLRHEGEIERLTADERHEMMDVTTHTVRIIREVMDPHGFNVGMNLGEVAGAGIPGHLHMHVVPRWGGDTNFMPVIGATKVLPELLDDTYRRLKPAFDSLQLL